MNPSSTTQQICVVAGMPRASTTFLYHTLASHPSCFVPSRKELEYFSLNGSRGDDWYRSFFADANPADTALDISPLYFFSPGCAQRISEYFKRPRVVLILRNPAEFIVSFYNNRRAADGESLLFEEFLAGYEYQKDGEHMHLGFRPGLFRERILEFQSVLGDNLLLIDFRSIQEDPLAALQAIERFLRAARLLYGDQLRECPK